MWRLCSLSSAQIGDDYTAKHDCEDHDWDATPAAAEELTRVVVLRLTVKAAYALQSADDGMI